MSRPLIEIDTPNKDIVISFVYAWARQKEMSILEQRVVLRIMEFASNHLKGFKLKDNLRQLDLGLFNVKIRMPASDVMFNTKMKHKDIEKALYALRSRTFEYKDQERYTVCGFINNATYVYRSGMITIEVDNRIWLVLTDLTKGFRRFELNKALALPTAYSLQFYMVMSGQEKPLYKTIPELKDWLGISPDKYKKDGKDRVDHIEERILRPVKKILDSSCPYTFDYKKVRANPRNSKSSVVGFEFFPVYQQKFRDPELEKTRLLGLTSTGFIAPQAVQYMQQQMSIPYKSISPHKELIDKAAHILPDFLGTLADIQGRRRKKDGSYMGIGWVIEAIKGEVRNAEEHKMNKDKPSSNSIEISGGTAECELQFDGRKLEDMKRILVDQYSSK